MEVTHANTRWNGHQLGETEDKGKDDTRSRHLSLSTVYRIVEPSLSLRVQLMNSSFASKRYRHVTHVSIIRPTPQLWTMSSKGEDDNVFEFPLHVMDGDRSVVPSFVQAQTAALQRFQRPQTTCQEEEEESAAIAAALPKALSDESSIVSACGSNGTLMGE